MCRWREEEEEGRDNYCSRTPPFAKIGTFGFGKGTESHHKERSRTGDVFLFSDHVDRERWRVLLFLRTRLVSVPSMGKKKENERKRARGVRPLYTVENGYCEYLGTGAK